MLINLKYFHQLVLKLIKATFDFRSWSNSGGESCGALKKKLYQLPNVTSSKEKLVKYLYTTIYFMNYNPISLHLLNRMKLFKVYPMIEIYWKYVAGYTLVLLWSRWWILIQHWGNVEFLPLNGLWLLTSDGNNWKVLAQKDISIISPSLEYSRIQLQKLPHKYSSRTSTS